MRAKMGEGGVDDVDVLKSVWEAFHDSWSLTLLRLLSHLSVSPHIHPHAHEESFNMKIYAVLAHSQTYAY